MLRDAQIPLALWASAAMLAHLVGGHSAAEVATVIHGKAEILAFSRSVRDELRPRTVEIDMFDDLSGTPVKSSVVPEPEQDDPEEEEKDEETKKAERPPDRPKKRVVPPPRPPPKALPPPKPPVVRPPPPEKKEPPKVERKPEPKPVVVPPPPAPTLPAPPPLVAKKPEPPKEPKKEEPKAEAPKKEPPKLVVPRDKRIAVINDPTTAKNQKDNPNAPRIADEANWAKEETMARFRAHDQNASKPSGGRQLTPGPTDRVGNAAEDKTAFSNPSEAPGAPRGGEVDESDEPEEAARRSPTAPPPARERLAVSGRPGSQAVAPGKGPKGGAPSTTPGGSWSISPYAGDGRPKRRARAGGPGIEALPYVPGLPGVSGFNTPGPYNLTQRALLAALGPENLAAERRKARNARLSRHRGTMQGTDFGRYRAAIENYDPAVKLGNQTSLNAASVPFASYINIMHNQIHPIFADGFLGSLDALDPTDKLNGQLVTHIEIVLEGATGKVVRMGITKPSGVSAFEVAALRSVEQAAPYGKAPDIIVSPDGNVYMHWEFHRDPYYACTSRFARPYLLREAPSVQPAAPLPEPPATPTEVQRYQGAGPLLPLAD